MANYVKATNFTAKDSLLSGDSGKIIKGAEIDTEFTAIASAVSSKANTNSPAFTGTPTGPTAGLGTNTTQLSSTAFVKNAIDDLGTIGTIASQDANAVAITGGTIAGITDLAVADGGTGSSTLAANAVLLGNGTSALQTVAPGTLGNLLQSNGTTWVSNAVSLQPTVVFDGTIAYNTTTTFTIANDKLTLWFLNIGGGFGGNGNITLGYQWGTSSLGSIVYLFNSGVDFQVFGSGAVLKSVAAGNGTQLLLNPTNNRVGSYGSSSQAQCLVVQF